MIKIAIIKKLPSGKYRLYSRKKDNKGKRRNLGTFDSLSAAQKRERQIQFFKGQHADDDNSLDHQTRALKGLSDIAQYLEEAGFIEDADKIYNTMSTVDNSLDQIPDNQLNVENENYTGSGYSMFNVFDAQKLAFIQQVIKFANELDQKGLKEEADELDNILKYLIDSEQDNADMIAGVNGLQGSSVVDNQGSGQFSGLSDSYFYRSYQTDEGTYEHRNELENKLTI